MKCPRCNTDTLFESDYEEISVRQCNRCHGHWLADDELTDIIHTRLKKFDQQRIRKTVAAAFEGIPTQEIENELNCPECNTAMNPVNYVSDSGVIIDRCPNNHGIWFDQSELDKAQAYREYWQDHMQQNEEYFVNLIEHDYDDKNKYDDIPPSLYLVSTVFHEYLDKFLAKIKGEN